MKFSDYFGRGVVEGHDNAIDIGEVSGLTPLTIPLGFTPKKIENVKVQVLGGYFYKQYSSPIYTIGEASIGTSGLEIQTFAASNRINLKIVGSDAVVELLPSSTHPFRLVFRVWEEK